MLKRSLQNKKIWLSASLPDCSQWEGRPLDRELIEFISIFSSLIMKKGGIIIHGCHPSITPTLVKQSEINIRYGTKDKLLSLYMSELWSIECSKSELSFYNKWTNFSAIEKSGDGTYQNADTRNKSLTKLRNVMAKESDMIISVGGKAHNNTTIVAGIPEEMDIALSFKKPGVIVPYFKGEAEKLVIKFRHDKNIRIANINASMSISSAVGEVVSDIENVLTSVMHYD